MHVGVVLKDQFPEHGGGFTFQGELVDALLRTAPASKHRFALVCSDAFAPYLPDVTGSGVTTCVYRHAQVQAPPAAAAVPRRSLARRAAGRLRRLVAPTPPAPSVSAETSPAPLSPLVQALAAAGFDYVWFVSQGHEIVDLPYMTTVWDLEHRNYPWFPELSNDGEWSRRDHLYALTLQRATCVITGTEVGAGEIAGFYGVPRSHLRILPHPTPGFASRAPAGDDAAVLARHGLRPGYLFYPAQFWPHKNHANLVLALDALARMHGIEPVLALSGSDKGCQAYIRSLADRLGLGDRVRFLGFVPQSDLPALYRGALALTYASFGGPENLPPLEAFALGCPVVAADIPGAREQLADCALLADPREPEALAAAMADLVRSEHRRAALIAAGRKRAASWTPADFAAAVFRELDAFEKYRRAWPSHARPA